MTKRRWQAITALFLCLSCGSSPARITSPTVPATAERQPEPRKISSSSDAHLATREDCELVVDQNVAAQLRASNVTDPAIIEKRRQEIRTAMADDIQACIGRKVTAETLTCVRSAETAQAIDACLQR